MDQAFLMDSFSDDLSCFDLKGSPDASIPIYLLCEDSFSSWLHNNSDQGRYRKWCAANNFIAKSGQCLAVSSVTGSIECLLVGCAEGATPDFADFWAQIPPGSYYLDAFAAEHRVKHGGLSLDENFYLSCYLSWARASYSYKPQVAMPKTLALNSDLTSLANNYAIAEYLVRNLINSPPNKMNPCGLSSAAAALAKQFNADFKEVLGADLLTQNYPAIHTVGKGSEFEPRLVEINWGGKDKPQVVLVGKGVCFDSGGLDIKSSAGMRHMKKDMAGAAHVLGLAHLIMAANLPINLKVLIPAVENAVGSRSYRPSDIIKMRNGKTVEISNTDAEGRLVLADALSSAAEADLIVDIATLTGAARVAVGPDIIPYFSSNPDVSSSLEDAAAFGETLLEMPLFADYRRYLKSNFADLKNAAEQPFAGTITAALFLENFIAANCDWLHFDIYAWQEGSKAQAAVQAIYTLFTFLQKRYD